MSAMLRLLAWCMAVALVALPVVAVVKGWVGGERWPLRTLRVQGDLQQVDRARLQATVLPHAQRGFFAVDLGGVQDAVDALPWVERADVRKHWPDVLEVSIREHRPFARWGKDKLLSERGLLFPAGSVQAPEGLPVLDGPESRVPEVMALYGEARERLADAGGVRGVLLDPRGSWTIVLRDGIEVVLGRNDPRERLERFAPLLPRLAAQQPGRRLVRADLRYTNGFSLTWAELPKASAASVSLPAPIAAARTLQPASPSRSGGQAGDHAQASPARGAGQQDVEGKT